MTMELEDAAEQGSVREGWERVEILERVGPAEAQRLFAPRWDHERARASASFRPLSTDDMAPEVRQANESPANVARYRRILDYLSPGERVFEVGAGKGYLAGIMLRDGEIGRYLGVELEEENVTSTLQVLEWNGLADRGSVEQGDLYELTREEVEQFGPDLVVCCEVLEHVPDPEAALEALANALPDGADLLISVPLLRRLDNVWGHIAIFGCARIRAMLHAAGLYPHTVDAVDNTWVLVLASRSRKPSPHARRAVQGVPDPTSALEEPLDRPKAVLNTVPTLLRLEKSFWTKRLSQAVVTPTTRGLDCAFDAEPGRTASSYGGVRFAVSNLRGIRLQLHLDEIDDVTDFYLDFNAQAMRVGRWQWDVTRSRPQVSPATFTLLPDAKGAFMRPQAVGDIEAADSVEFFAKLKPGGHARFTLSQVGFIV